MLSQENGRLKFESGQTNVADLSKNKICGLLSQKASEADSEAKQCQKAFERRETDLNQFLSNYIKGRQEYHKYQILKVKVNMS